MLWLETSLLWYSYMICCCCMIYFTSLNRWYEEVWRATKEVCLVLERRLLLVIYSSISELLPKTGLPLWLTVGNIAEMFDIVFRLQAFVCPLNHNGHEKWQKIGISNSFVGKKQWVQCDILLKARDAPRKVLGLILAQSAYILGHGVLPRFAPLNPGVLR